MAVRHFVSTVAAAVCLAAPLAAQNTVTSTAQGVSINLVDTELRSAVLALQGYLDRPVTYSQLGNQRITFTSPRPLARDEVAAILRMILQEQGYTMEEVGGAYRIAPVPQAPPAQPPPAAPQPQPQPGAGQSLARSGDMQLYVIRLRHARAADVAATVNALYGRASALGEVGRTRGGGTLSEQLADNANGAYGAQNPQGAPPGAPRGELSGNIAIVPDFRTNSLLIRANEGDFGLINAAVQQVDVRPLQVLIEATVAYVRRDFSFALGLGASTPNTRVGDGNTTIGGEARSNTSLGDIVIRALDVGGIDLDLVLSAGESRSNVVILDRPLLLAANNEEAEINVGEQRPFTQIQRSTDGGVLDEVVQYKDVGTTLRVLPTISADGFVQLQVVQEVNSAAGSAQGLDAPIITTRSITTQLLVRDGRTAVLGGLTGSQRERSSGGVPFLSSIPFLGAVFGRKERENNDFELFVFITPHVIGTDEQMDDARGDVERNGGRAGRVLRRLKPIVTEADETAERAAVEAAKAAARQSAAELAPPQTAPAPTEAPPAP